MHTPEYNNEYPHPTYFTVSIDTTGAKHYTEHDPRYTAPVKAWTVYPDGRRQVTLPYVKWTGHLVGYAEEQP